MRSAKERFKNIQKLGLEKNFLHDWYHRTLIMTWWQFFAIYVAVFVSFNLFFGFLFFLLPGGISNTDGSFFKSFSFSVQTFTTIGYGLYAPTETLAHVLVMIESMCAMLFTALLTGLAFAKFTRPTARIRFTDRVAITTFDGKRALVFRLANLRGNQIAEASVKATVLATKNTIEGHTMRMQQDLNFVRSTSSFFVLSWTVLHYIDKDSPLYGLKPHDFKKNNVEISVSVLGHDETFSQTVHASGIYGPEDFVFDKYFADIIISQGDKIAAIDYARFNSFKDQS